MLPLAVQKRTHFFLAGLLVALVGCRAAVSPAAACRERESHRYDPGAVAIAEAPRVVRTIRCVGPFGDLEAPCSDDAPPAIRFTVTTSHGPPRCSAGDTRACWWESAPNSHGQSPGRIHTATGAYTFSGTTDASGGSPTIIAYVGVARASTTLGVRLVLVENPGHVASDVIDALRGAGDARASVRIHQPPDGSVWPIYGERGEPLRIPTIEVDGRITAARVQIENGSHSIAYDGYFAGSPIALSNAAWTAIHRSTEQNDALVVRVSTVSAGVVTVSPEQRWHVDHGNFYHSPESLAQGREDEARAKREREARERVWIQSHSYISRGDAIARAIRFLEDQGFTNAPPAAPLRRDIMESGSEAEVRASRRGSIEPAVVGTVKKAGGWWVAFRSVDGDRCRVRVIAVAPDGARAQMIHQDISLSAFE